jgi:penicillin-binding protein 2
MASMRNRPTNIFSDDGPTGGGLDAAWQVDRRPGLRLVWLFTAMTIPLLVIAGRLAYLQCCLLDDYVASFETTSETLESIASVDGRIYGSDGRVLAEDVERYNISVHYRWLEDPPDARWLSQQALSKLPRAKRRNRALVDAEKRRVIALRDAMWARLAKLSGTQPSRLAAERGTIQNRVERIAAIVDDRHAERDRQRATRSDSTDEPKPVGKRLWDVAVEALTTPPHRDEREPIIVREETDYHPMIEDVPLDVRAQIEAHPRWFPGVRVGCTSRRVYRESGWAPHVVGRRLGITDDEVGRRKSESAGSDPLDYRPGDRIGRTGVEAAYDSHLRGLRGARRLVRNRYGEILRAEVVRAPRAGGNVELTLNADVERKMEQLLDAILSGKQKTDGADADQPLIPQGAAVIAMDVQSGALLVAASAPRFDFGPSGTPDPTIWKTVNDDPRHPLFHRATQMALPPGSVFKAVSAIALLESPKFDSDARFECQGFLERPDHFRCPIYTHQKTGHGPTDLSDALCRSCNVYFYHAAGQIGPQPIVEWGQRFGFGRPTGIDLPFERGGNLPEPSQPHWQIADTRYLAIGQSTLTATPLQVARMMAAIANGGYLVTPFIARKSGPQVADDEIASPSRRQRIAGLSDGTLARLRADLERVVADPEGTGYKTVGTPQIAIAGKTGTAEVGKGKADHAWFAGFAPAQDPRIAFAIVLEHAGSGGRAAGPIARQLVEALLADGVLEPARVTMRE